MGEKNNQNENSMLKKFFLSQVHLLLMPLDKANKSFLY